jgi:hypothetical protein
MIERCSRVHVLAMAAGVASLTLVGWAMTAPAQTAGKTGELSFAAADTNGDGFVDEAELAADQAKRFASLDASGDGALEPDELEGEDPAALARLDRNRDGKLSFQEAMAGKLQDFRRADGSGDGRLSLDEVVQFEASR